MHRHLPALTPNRQPTPEFRKLTSPTEERGPALATASQVTRMGILAQKVYSKDELESVFRPWLRENYNGVSSRKALTTAQAADVIAKLEAAERALDGPAGK